jgi:hypothetical protein
LSIVDELTHKILQLKANELATQNALKRWVTVFFKRSKENVPIYDNDIEAIKTLNTAIENASKSQVNDNLLFAKLLAYVMMEHYTEYKASIKIAADILKNL